MKSYLGRIWNDSDEFKSLELVFAKLLQKLNLESHEAISEFLSPSLQGLHDPFLMDSMNRAVKRILKAIKAKERIMIFGDFDTDGIASTVILVDAIKNLGGIVSYRIPERNQDSHGLKKHLLDEIFQKKASLIITCDCGINDQEAVNYAKKLGMDIIITDHHESRKTSFPDQAIAVLNPKKEACNYPEKNLAGASVTFKLVSALAETVFKDPQEIAEFLGKYLEICALGQIADCVDLVGESRILTHFGLKQMKNSQWDGLQKMFEKMGLLPENLSAETIGYYIAPKLNAASRIGDVLIATQLFLGEKDRNFERLSYLERLNETRKQMTQKAILEAEAQIEKTKPFQFLIHDNWIPGILGLICSNLVEKLDQPIIAVRKRSNGMLNASCRAPEGASIISALESCDKELFTNFGGHDGAAGFIAPSKNLVLIKDQLSLYFEKNKKEISKTSIMGFLNPDVLTFNLSEFLNQMAPFGAGNKEPVWGLRDLEVSDFLLMGKEKNHLRLKTRFENKELEFVGFFLGNFAEKLKKGKKIDVLFTISENFFRDKRRLQFRLVDVRNCE